MRRSLTVVLAVLLSVGSWLTAVPTASAVSAGRLPLAPPAVEGSILRLYQAAYGREADDGGLDYWVSRYRDGLPLSTVASYFIGADEFVARYGTPSDSAFVDLLYANVLGRAPDASGKAYWQGQLAGGAPRWSVLLGFSESPELVTRTGTASPAAPRRLLAVPGVEHSIARVYLGFLQRWPDDGGYDYWVGQYAHGYPLAGITNAMLATPEMSARYGGTTNAQFVQALYVDVLGRPSDPSGASYWQGVLNSGVARGVVATSFTESSEMVGRTRTATPVAPIPHKLVAVGDSVMLGAVNQISAIAGWSNYVDARGCRQPTTRGDGCGAVNIPSAIDALVTARQAGALGGVVAIQVSNNGPMSDAQFDQVMAQVADQPLVLWLTLHEPRPWEGSNNAVMFNGAARWANVRVLDWHALSQGQPWFSDGEGIHLNSAGAQAMANLIASGLPA